ncbi:MAG: hypothetical protein PXY39_02105 [archaeon]|nr:hypothetical protein [archaeon]
MQRTSYAIYVTRQGKLRIYKAARKSKALAIFRKKSIKPGVVQLFHMKYFGRGGYIADSIRINRTK